MLAYPVVLGFSLLTCLFLRKFFMRFALPITLFGNDHVDLDAMDDKGDIAQILMLSLIHI